MKPCKIVAVHGLANKPPRAPLSERWLASIVEGLDCNEGGAGRNRFDFSLVYWADLYFNPLLPDDAPSYRYEPWPAGKKLPEYKDAWADIARRTLLDVGGDAADAIGRIFGREILSDDLLRDKFPDLHAYYNDQKFGEKVRQRVKDELVAAAGQRIILIAHSMGAIIALDVLRDSLWLNERPFVDTFITVGSPLGLPYVIHQQYHEFGQPKVPERIARWHNLSERRDHICFDTHLRDDYGRNDEGLEVVDDLVINTVDRDRHISYGYARAPELSRLLANRLTNLE